MSNSAKQSLTSRSNETEGAWVERYQVIPNEPRTANESLSVDNPHIAFIGKMGAGKTEAARYLVEELGYTKLSFAQHLRNVVTMIWGSSAINDREKLQKLGVAVREIDGDAWANYLFSQIDTLNSALSLEVGPGPEYVATPSPQRIVIDDCRFPNEYWGLMERAFVPVRIWAPEYVREDRLMRNGKLTDRDQLYHKSETALDGVEIEHEISNTDSLSELYDGINAVLERERSRT